MYSHWNQRYFENGVKFAYLDITKSEFTILPNVQVICKKKKTPAFSKNVQIKCNSR